MLSAILNTALTIMNGVRREEGANAGCLHGNPAFLNLSMDLHNDKSGKAHFCHAIFAQISGSKSREFLEPIFQTTLGTLVLTALTFGAVTFQQY